MLDEYTVCRDGWMYCMQGWMEGWMDGWIDEGLDGWVN